MFGTHFIPIPVSSDSSSDDDNGGDNQGLHQKIRSLKRRCKDLEHDLYIADSLASAERERRMFLEAHIGGNLTLLNKIHSTSICLVNMLLLAF